MKLGITLKRFRLSQNEQETTLRILDNTGGWIARHLNKPLSLPVSIVLARRGITPNQITAFNMFLGILAGVVASLGDYLYVALGGILFQLVSIIDGCDGEVAKFNNCSSRFGAWFDTFGDNLAFVIFITGVTFGLYHQTHAAWIMWAAKISLVSFALLLSIMVHYLIRQAGGKASLVTYEKEVVSQSISKQNTFISRFIYFGKFLVKKDFFAFLFFVLAILGLPQAIVFFSALGTSAVAIVLLSITVMRSRAKRTILAESATEVAQ